jgi:hypothetical protein
MNPSAKGIQDVIAELRLKPFDQDWGIINADAARVDEASI